MTYPGPKGGGGLCMVPMKVAHLTYGSSGLWSKYRSSSSGSLSSSFARGTSESSELRGVMLELVDRRL